MKLSLQSRVLALVGAGVFLAGAALAVLSQSSLRSLDQEVKHDHERLAASLAREVSRALGDDMRLLAGVAAAEPEILPYALYDVHRFGHLASAAFAVDNSGRLIACEPAAGCVSLQQRALETAALTAISTQRPLVTDPIAHQPDRPYLAGIIPFRPVEGRSVAAAGIAIDPSDRRLGELLRATDIAPTLEVVLRAGSGEEFATAVGAAGGTPSYTVSAKVAGTPWTLELSDLGPDPSAPIQAFRRQSFWLAPTLAGVAMLLGWGIAGSVRRPLVRMTWAAERIAGGDLSGPIDTSRAADGGDEVGRLALALERMRRELQESIDTIEATNRELEQRVEARTRELAAANARLEDRERLRQKLLRQVISAQEDERKRIARELHDETSQSLAALGMGVDLALAECGEAVPARQRLLDTRRLVSRMHDELHRMIVNLRPSVLDDLGLEAAIRWFAERELGAAGIAVRCELTDLDVRLPPEIETATFRAVQEALVNVARHASAESVLIQGEIERGTLVIEIEDDGVGFDEAAVVRSPESLRGIGLLGMQERIEILGGTLKIESSPGNGTRVLFSIPVPETVAQAAGGVGRQAS